MEVLPIDGECAHALFVALKLEGFFPELTPEQARMLFPRSARERHAAGSPVVRQGDAGRDLYVIESGTVAVTQTFGSAGGQLSNLGAGELFGEMALIKDGIRRASVTTVTDAVIFRLAFQDVQYLLKENKRLGEHLQALAVARS